MCEVPPSLWRHLTHQRSNNTIITKNPGEHQKGQRRWRQRVVGGGGAMTIFGENDYFNFLGVIFSITL